MGYNYEDAIARDTSVEVQEGEWGKGVHAKKEGIEKGDVLWKEAPMFVGKCKTLGETCGFCFKLTGKYEGKTPLPALPPGCTKEAFGTSSELGTPVQCEHGCEWYCSEVCRQAAWSRYHKVVCGEKYKDLLQHLTEKEKVGNQRVVSLKMLCASKVCSEEVVRAHLDRLVELPEGSDDSVRTEYDEDIFARFTACTEGNWEAEQYFKMLSKMKANAVELDLGLRLDEEDKLEPDTAPGARRATGIFALQAFVNHSCSPNGHRVFHNGTLHFVAVKDIAHSAQVVMAYVNPSNTIKERQAKLRSHWHIACTCERCTADTLKLILFRQLLGNLKK